METVVVIVLLFCFVGVMAPVSLADRIANHEANQPEEEAK